MGWAESLRRRGERYGPVRDNWRIQADEPAPYDGQRGINTNHRQTDLSREPDVVDTVMNASDLNRSSAVAAAMPTTPEDDLAFFHALWFWIPAGLGLWAAFIWTLMRLV
jgi:hypothetical protein